MHKIERKCDGSVLRGFGGMTRVQYILTISETIVYVHIVTELVTARSRAFGALTSKYFQIEGLDCKSFTKLLGSMVTQVMDYLSGIWGYKIYDKL